MKITIPHVVRRQVPKLLLSDPGAAEPTAIIDTREQTPLTLDLPSIPKGLTSGDYSFVGGEHLFAVERKSLADLIACVTRERERFERELIRLRGYRFRRLLIVGTPEDLEGGHYVSQTPPTAIAQSLAVWEVRYDIPYIFACAPDIAGRIVSNWIRAFARELVKDATTMAVGSPAASPSPNPKPRQQAA